jgi:hypothetical protein
MEGSVAKEICRAKAAAMRKMIPSNGARGKRLSILNVAWLHVITFVKQRRTLLRVLDLVADRARSRQYVVISAIGLFALTATSARLFVWPELPPLPPRADAIIEIGGPGDRDEAALALARDGKAPVLIQSTVEEEAGTDRCLPPVPGVTILCFHAVPNSTRGEARYIGRMAQHYHWSSVIIVTTQDHAWRARWRVGRCFSGAVYVSTIPVAPWRWLVAIPYQWSATLKALIFERDC